MDMTSYIQNGVFGQQGPMSLEQQQSCNPALIMLQDIQNGVPITQERKEYYMQLKQQQMGGLVNSLFSCTDRSQAQYDETTVPRNKAGLPTRPYWNSEAGFIAAPCGYDDDAVRPPLYRMPPPIGAKITPPEEIIAQGGTPDPYITHLIETGQLKLDATNHVVSVSLTEPQSTATPVPQPQPKVAPNVTPEVVPEPMAVRTVAPAPVPLVVSNVFSEENDYTYGYPYTAVYNNEVHNMVLIPIAINEIPSPQSQPFQPYDYWEDGDDGLDIRIEGKPVSPQPFPRKYWEDEDDYMDDLDYVPPKVVIPAPPIVQTVVPTPQPLPQPQPKVVPIPMEAPEVTRNVVPEPTPTPGLSFDLSQMPPDVLADVEAMEMPDLSKLPRAEDDPNYIPDPPFIPQPLNSPYSPAYDPNYPIGHRGDEYPIFYRPENVTVVPDHILVPLEDGTPVSYTDSEGVFYVTTIPKVFETLPISDIGPDQPSTIVHVSSYEFPKELFPEEIRPYVHLKLKDEYGRSKTAVDKDRAAEAAAQQQMVVSASPMSVQPFQSYGYQYTALGPNVVSIGPVVPQPGRDYYNPFPEFYPQQVRPFQPYGYQQYQYGYGGGLRYSPYAPMMSLQMREQLKKQEIMKAKIKLRYISTFMNLGWTEEQIDEWANPDNPKNQKTPEQEKKDKEWAEWCMFHYYETHPPAQLSPQQMLGQQIQNQINVIHRELDSHSLCEFLEEDLPRLLREIWIDENIKKNATRQLNGTYDSQAYNELLNMHISSNPYLMRLLKAAEENNDNTGTISLSSKADQELGEMMDMMAEARDRADKWLKNRPSLVNPILTSPEIVKQRHDFFEDLIAQMKEKHGENYQLPPSEDDVEYVLVEDKPREPVKPVISTKGDRETLEALRANGIIIDVDEDTG